MRDEFFYFESYCYFDNDGFTGDLVSLITRFDLQSLPSLYRKNISFLNLLIFTFAISDSFSYSSYRFFLLSRSFRQIPFAVGPLDCGPDERE